MPLDAERIEYYKEKVREIMREQGEAIDEEKVERVVSDLMTLAEIFVDQELERLRAKTG